MRSPEKAALAKRAAKYMRNWMQWMIERGRIQKGYESTVARHLTAFAAREVDRERRAARKDTPCRDCGCLLVVKVHLCDSCHYRRNDEGMDTDDPRTIQQWRKT